MRMRGPDHTRIAVVSTIALAMLAGAAMAQQQTPPPASGGIIIGGSNAPPQSHESCVEVEIGGERSFGCLNQRMKRDADRTVPVPNIAPLDAHSPDTRLGIVNIPAVKQQLGTNFGISAFPQRPGAPVFPGVHR
jgi:hypothetical protein